MKHYFVNGIEISESEANQIEKQNKELINSGSFDDLMKCEFITVLDY